MTAAPSPSAHARTSACKIEDCVRPVAQTGYCSRHYYRLRRYGDANAATPKGTRMLPLERFIASVTLDDGCWLWGGALDGHGYGTIRQPKGASRQYVGAHRFSYELLVAPIPPGLDIDHLCRVPACVRPDHLEPVTRGENTRRGTAHARRREVMLSRSDCRQGHAWTPATTYIRPNGARSCRTCQNLRDRARRAAATA